MTFFAAEKSRNSCKALIQTITFVEPETIYLISYHMIQMFPIRDIELSFLDTKQKINVMIDT